MKKLFLFLLLGAFVVLPAYVQAQTSTVTYSCPPGYTLDQTDQLCHADDSSMDPQTVPSTVSTTNPNPAPATPPKTTTVTYTCPAGSSGPDSNRLCTYPDGSTKKPLCTGTGCPKPAAATPPKTASPASPNTTGGAADCDPAYNTSKNGLCLPKNPLGDNLTGIAGTGSVTGLAAKIIDILLYFAGIVAVIFVIIGGYRYMTAGGTEESAEKGRKTMTNAIIGLVIVILAYVIITTVTNFLLNK